MRILNKIFTKNKLKNNIECDFKHSIACSAIKRLFLSQEILIEERVPPGSHEENNALPFCVPLNLKLAMTVVAEASFIICYFLLSFFSPLLTLFIEQPNRKKLIFWSDHMANYNLPGGHFSIC